MKGRKMAGLPEAPLCILTNMIEVCSEREAQIEAILKPGISDKDTVRVVCQALIDNFLDYLDQEKKHCGGESFESVAAKCRLDLIELKKQVLKSKICRGKRIKINKVDVNELIKEFKDLENALEAVKVMGECRKNEILGKKLKEGKYFVDEEGKSKYEGIDDYKQALYSDFISTFSERFDKICSSELKHKTITPKIMYDFGCRLAKLKIDYGVLGGDHDAIVKNLRYSVVSKPLTVKTGTEEDKESCSGNACYLQINGYDHGYFVSDCCYNVDEAKGFRQICFSNGDFESLLADIELYVKKCGRKIDHSISKHYDRGGLGRILVSGEDFSSCDVWEFFKKVTGFSDGSYRIKDGDGFAILECSSEGVKIRPCIRGDSAKLLFVAKKPIL